jgi:hypothetical protein
LGIFIQALIRQFVKFVKVSVYLAAGLIFVPNVYLDSIWTCTAQTSTVPLGLMGIRGLVFAVKIVL